jgi:hypothetical protein
MLTICHCCDCYIKLYGSFREGGLGPGKLKDWNPGERWMRWWSLRRRCHQSQASERSAVERLLLRRARGTCPIGSTVVPSGRIVSEIY